MSRLKRFAHQVLWILNNSFVTVPQHRYPLLQLLISKKYKFVYCAISKNGCSSILSSILRNDYGKYFPNEKIWQQIPTNDELKNSIRDNSLYFWKPDDIDIIPYDSFRVFIVLRNPLDRFISLINNTHKEREYDNVFNKLTFPRLYVNSVLKRWPEMIKYEINGDFYDKHAVPQKVYYDLYKEMFGDRLEIVNIKDLPSYYKELTGCELVKNNVTQPSQKICTADTLTKKQRAIIEDYISQYPLPVSF